MSFKNILDTLEGDDFSKDWEEYQKYKQMKEKLPDIEEMYQLKRLKVLTTTILHHDNIINTTRLDILKYSGKTSHSMMMHKEGLENFLSDQIRIKEETVNEIESIFEYLRSKGNQKNLLELFKLYAISTDWLRP